MTKRAQIRKLQRRARQLGEDLRGLVTRMDEQREDQAQQLDRWTNEMSNLLTFLLNLEDYLEMNENDGMDGQGRGLAGPDGRS